MTKPVPGPTRPLQQEPGEPWRAEPLFRVIEEAIENKVYSLTVYRWSPAGHGWEGPEMVSARLLGASAAQGQKELRAC
jgi:hypothetical protein